MFKKHINILAIDTSLDSCSVALRYKNKIQEFYSDLPQERSKKLINILDKCLLDIRSEELHALAFAAGPGSLTGLKIASSIIQGLSLGYNLPILKVSTLYALALQAYIEVSEQLKLYPKFIMPCIDAKMNQVYYSIYAINHTNNHSNYSTQCYANKVKVSDIAIADKYHVHKDITEDITDRDYIAKLNCIYPDSLNTWEEIGLLLKGKWQNNIKINTKHNDNLNGKKNTILQNNSNIGDGNNIAIPQSMSNIEFSEQISNGDNQILIVGDSKWLKTQTIANNVIYKAIIHDTSIHYSAKNIIQIADYLYANRDIISLSTDAVPLYIRSYN